MNQEFAQDAERSHGEIVDELVTRNDEDINHVNNLRCTALLEATIWETPGRTAPRPRCKS
jgi:hypothetical protein